MGFCRHLRAAAAALVVAGGAWMAAGVSGEDAAELMIPLSGPAESLPDAADLIPWPQGAYPVLDMSGIGNAAGWLFDAPAGKHGKVKAAKDGKLAFADGTPARFWGTTTVYGMTFPEKPEEIVKLADAIAARGYNMVRFHHNDICGAGLGYLATSPKSNAAVDPKGIDRLDKFAAELIKRGIYLYVDLIDYRSVQPEDGLEEAFPGLIKMNANGWKGIFPHPAVVAAWKKAATALLDHKNPYTGNRWADEPAVVMVEIINENGPFWDWSFQVPDSVQKWYDAAWNEWLKQKYGTREKLAQAWTDQSGQGGLFPDEDPAKGTVFRPRLTGDLDWDRPYRSRTRGASRMNDYYAHLAEIAQNFYAEAQKHLRSLGHAGPVIGSHEKQGPLDRQSLSTTGVIASHLYAPALPAWGARPASAGVSISGVDITSNNWFSNLFRIKVAGVPGVNGEWTGGSTTQRADVNVAVAAACAFQGVAQSAHFSYGHRWVGEKMPDCDFNFLYKHYLNKIAMNFSYAHDAAWMAVNPVAAALFVRGDFQKPKHKVQIAFSAEDAHEQTKHSLGQIGGSETVGGAALFLPVMHEVESYFFDQKYDGDADVVFTTGRTASGDYSAARHAVIIGDNPWQDRYHKSRDLGAPARAVRPGVKTADLKTAVTFRVEWPWANGRDLAFDSYEGAVEAGTVPAGAQTIGKSADGKYVMGWLDEKYLVVPNAGALDKKIGDKQWLLRLYLMAAKKWNIDTGKNAAGAPYLASDTGELLADWAFGTLQIDTPRTQGFSGLPGWRPENKTSALSLKLLQPYGNVLATSTDGKPLNVSERILLAAAGRIQNTGQVNGKNKDGGYTVLNTGKAPVLVEGLRGTVRLTHAKAGELAVYALDPAGKPAARVAATVEGGVLVIPLTPDNRTIWYEIASRKDEAVPAVAAAASAGAQPGYPLPKTIALAEYLRLLNKGVGTEKKKEESGEAVLAGSGLQEVWLVKFDDRKAPGGYGNYKGEITDDAEKGAVLQAQYGKVNEKDWFGGWWSNLTPPAGLPAGAAKKFGIVFRGDGTMPRDAFVNLVSGGIKYVSKNQKALFENDGWRVVLFSPEDFAPDPGEAKKMAGKPVPPLTDFNKVSRLDFNCVGPLMEQKTVGYVAGVLLGIEGKVEATVNPFATKMKDAVPAPAQKITLPQAPAGTPEPNADGKIDEAIWAQALGIALDEGAVPQWQFFGTHIVSGEREKGEGAKFWLLAFDSGLGVIAQVEKGGAPVVAQRADWYMNDCVELFTDPANSGGKPAKQLFLAYRKAGADLPAASDPGIRIGRAKTEGGYLLEALIPWQALGFAQKPAAEFGLEFQLDFAAAGRGRTLQMGYGTSTNEAWINAGHYLKATLAPAK